MQKILGCLGSRLVHRYTKDWSVGLVPLLSHRYLSVVHVQEDGMLKDHRFMMNSNLPPPACDGPINHEELWRNRIATMNPAHPLYWWCLWPLRIGHNYHTFPPLYVVKSNAAFRVCKFDIVCIVCTPMQSYRMMFTSNVATPFAIQLCILFVCPTLIVYSSYVSQSISCLPS